ncbi:MAG: thioredoxin domain-containing protein [Candidatus Nanohaloarchaea archaeon]
MTEENQDEGIEIELSTNQAIGLSLVIGLVIGGIGGFAGANIMAPTSQQSPSDSTGSQDLSPEETFRQISNDLGLNTDKIMQCYKSSENKEAEKDRASIANEVGNIGTPTFFVGNRQKGFIEITGAQPLGRFKEAINTIQQENPNSSANVSLVSLEGIELEGEPSKGQEDAPIKILEYDDYGCPFCSEWNGYDASSRIPINKLEVAKSLEKQYVDTGQVELIVKDLPVPQLHPNSPKAHKVANCVYKYAEDSYFEFGDELFKRREKWMAR